MATKKSQKRTSARKDSSEGLLESAARTAGAIAGEFANVILGNEPTVTAPHKKTAKKKSARRPVITKKTKAKVSSARAAVRKSVKKVVSKAKRAKPTAKKRTRSR